MSKLPIFEHFLSAGNLKPKLKWVFKTKLKPKIVLLNWTPVGVGLPAKHRRAHARRGGEDVRLEDGAGPRLLL